MILPLSWSEVMSSEGNRFGDAKPDEQTGIFLQLGQHVNGRMKNKCPFGKSLTLPVRREVVS